MTILSFDSNFFKQEPFTLDRRSIIARLDFLWKQLLKVEQSRFSSVALFIKIVGENTTTVLLQINFQLQKKDKEKN